MTATLTPTSSLAASSVYVATITAGAKNSAGVAMAALYTWSFTTAGAGVVAPTVVSTDPANAATLVPLNKQVSATFSVAMDGTSLTTTTFTLMNGLVAVPGAVSSVGATATFAPTALLAPSTTYTASVSTGAKDTAGTAMAAPYTWTFTTGTAIGPPALAINLGAAASFGIAARAGLTSTGVTVVNGDVALSPTPTCTDSTGNAGASRTCLVKVYNSPTGMTVNGSIYWAGDPFDSGVTAARVTTDLNAAWVEGMAKVDTLGPVAGDQMDLKTFNPGVYHNANLGLAAGGTATLDALGDANGVFIFKVDSDFVDSGTLLLPTNVVLRNGAQARNVWFVAGRDVTVGSGTHWNGNILAGRTATVKDGSTVLGRVLAGAAGAGAITLTGAASPSVTSITVP